MLIENPLSFVTKKQLPDFLIEYKNLFEVCQGGPEVGDLYINNKKIEGYRFGGPSLISQNIIYVSIYISNRFKLGCINISTNDIETLGNFFDVIFPYNIGANKIYCYTNIEGTKTVYFNIV